MSATNILHHGCTDPQVERLIEVRRFFVANFEKISAIKCGLHFSTSLFGVEGPFNKTNSHSFIVAIVIVFLLISTNKVKYLLINFHFTCQKCHLSSY